MLNKIIVGAAALLIIGGLGYVVTNNFAPQDPNQNTAQAPTPSAPEKNTTKTASKSPGTYEEYSEDKLQKAEEGQVVLFFNAVWCPDCRATVRDLEANRDNIPEGLTILNVDYDKNTSLKQKYSVTYQHTFVQVDKNGNQIKKWGGSFTLDEIVNQTQ